MEGERGGGGGRRVVCVNFFRRSTSTAVLPVIYLVK